MKHSFGQTLPDKIGFAIVGATAGAMLSGGADFGVTLQSALGCLGGALLAPALMVTPWTRLLRVRWTRRVSAALQG